MPKFPNIFSNIGSNTIENRRTSIATGLALVDAIDIYDKVAEKLSDDVLKMFPSEGRPAEIPDEASLARAYIAVIHYKNEFKTEPKLVGAYNAIRHIGIEKLKAELKTLIPEVRRAEPSATIHEPASDSLAVKGMASSKYPKTRESQVIDGVVSKDPEELAVIAQLSLREKVLKEKAVDWVSQRSELLSKMNTEYVNFAAACVGYSQSLTLAFDQFNNTVKEAAAANQAKIDMLKAGFEALKAVPMPFGAIGHIGSLACSQLHTTDASALTRLTYSAPMEASEPVKSLAGTVMEKCGQYKQKFNNATLVGNDVSKLDNDIKLRSAFFDICKEYLLTVQSEFPKLLDKCFGEAANTSEIYRQRFKAVEQELFGEARSNKLNEELIKKKVTEKIKGWGEELWEEAKSKLITMDFGALQTEDMTAFIELHLLCGYVLVCFTDDKNAGQDYDKLTIEEAVIKRLQMLPDKKWRVLSETGAHHASRKAGQLVWKGDTNHKKALVFFCKYLKRRYGMFDLLCKLQKVPSGTQVTAESISQDLNQYKDKLSELIAGHRSKGLLDRKTTWDWKTIERKMVDA